MFKPVSVTTNVVGLQTASAGHVGAAVLANVARRSGFQADAVVVTERGVKENVVIIFFTERLVFLSPVV